MKKIIFVISLFFSMLISVNAASISNIEMDIHVDELGTATITEIWTASVYEGTEGYHPYYNIGSSGIRVVSASMDGRPFEVIDSWNESSSLESKAYKAGLYYPSTDEVDIVFGISEYGTHTYQVVYEISNFVVSLSDADMIYWTLFPSNFSAEPGNVSIKITADTPFEDTIEVWGFGKRGAPTYVANGEIVMTSDHESVYPDEYMTILVKLPKGRFEPTSIIDQNFDYYLDMANQGAVKYNQKQKTEKLLSIIEKYFSFFVIIIIVLFYFFMYFVVPNAISFIFSPITNLMPDKDFRGSKRMDFSQSGGTSLKEAVPFREIPCDNNLLRAYYIANVYGIGNLNKMKETLIGAFILKWIKDKNVRVEKVEKNILGVKKQESVIILDNTNGLTPDEITLYNFISLASKDKRLEPGELKKWSRSNYDRLLNWFKRTPDLQKNALIVKGLIKKEETVSGFLKLKKEKFVVTQQLKEEALKLKGLQMFLKEFSNIQEKEAIEVNLWNDYLIFAQLLGLAKEVMKQFKKLYPEIGQLMDQSGIDLDTYVFINHISTSSLYTARTASTAHDLAESYSSGGGGFSSGGGGGGSFGGGGGGGGFR